MGHKQFLPSGSPYDETDPLGLLKQEIELEKRLEEPNPVQLFLEWEATKKDEARKLRIENHPNYWQLREEFNEVLAKLMKMVVSFKKGNSYIQGRIEGIGSGTLKILERGTKKEYWVDFDEVLHLRKGYK